MKNVFFLVLTAIAVASCGSSDSDSNSPANSINEIVARTSSQICEVEAINLKQAKLEFTRYCGQTPRDCDPINNMWVCSSAVIGSNAPQITTACSATGETLNAATQNYSASCTLPRRDCDPLDGGWLCSSEQIGASAPAFSVAVYTPAQTPQVDFLEGLSLAEQWNELGLAAVRAGLAKPTVTAHQMFMLSASMYDAFAVYNNEAVPYALDNTTRPIDSAQTTANMEEAVSQAAYQILVRMFPKYEDQNGFFLQQLVALGYRPANAKNQSASGIGLAAALAVLEERSTDGSNYQNDYAETVSLTYPETYQPFNKPGSITQLNDFGESFDPNRWQPLRVPNGTVVDGLSRPIIDNLNLDSFGDQMFLSPHWGGVTPFAVSFGAALRPIGPPKYGSDAPYTDALGVESSNHEAYLRQVGEVVAFSAGLTDEHKVIAEFWADGPRTESPPGHWNQIAHGVIGRDKMTTEASVKLFFTLNAALLDASIVTWEAKRYYDYIRPASAIRFLFDGKLIQAWGGPNQGTQHIPGESWSPYQSLTFVTPPFPEYVSGHSTFSRASAEVLTLFTGSERFYDGVTQTSQDVNGDGELDYLGEHIAPAGSFFIEAGPAEDVVLRWGTFREAADEAGKSRLFGGIHIQDGDLRGREIGAQVGRQAFAIAQMYFDGTVHNCSDCFDLHSN